MSADGGKVLFTSISSTLVSGDVSSIAADIHLKNFNGNGVTRVVQAPSAVFSCLGMTPDANTVVFAAHAPVSEPNVFGVAPTEPAILVKNISTGQQTRVTPPLSAFPNVSAYQFAGVSDDGLRVAFIAQPTRTCIIFDCTASGPARMLIRNLATGQLINLESAVRFTTQQGLAFGNTANALISRDGRVAAFDNNSSNLLGASPVGGGAQGRAYRKLLP